MVIACGLGARRGCAPELHLPDEIAAKLRFARRTDNQDEVWGVALVDGGRASAACDRTRTQRKGTRQVAARRNRCRNAGYGSLPQR